MKLNDFVLVTNESSELYRRRCQIVNIEGNKITVYSEGLEEQEVLSADDLVPAKW